MERGSKKQELENVEQKEVFRKLSVKCKKYDLWNRKLMVNTNNKTIQDRNQEIECRKWKVERGIWE